VRCTARSARICDGPGRPQDAWQEAARLPRPVTAHAAWRVERADPSASFALPTGSATGFSAAALRPHAAIAVHPLPRVCRRQFDRALPRRRKTCWPKNGPGIRRSAESVVRHSLARESGRRARTKTVIPLLRDRWFESGSLQQHAPHGEMRRSRPA